MQSIFRYPGGKTRKNIREWILSNRPNDIREYREPFVGGGGIYFAMGDPGKRWINDRHAGLIEVYKALNDRPEAFISKCREVAPPVDGEQLTEPGPRGNARYPKRMLDVFNSVKLDQYCDQAFRYFYVNRTVFGGRVNYDIPSRLYFSNPDGWNITTGNALRDAAAHINGTRITCGDYAPLLSEPGENVWVYCDPPYAVNTDFSPTSQLYQHGFSRDDHKRFADAVASSPHKVCISYDDDSDGFIRGLFSDPKFRIVEASWTYCGSTNDKKEVGRELLILNYEPPTTALTAPENVQVSDSLDDEERDQLRECEFMIDAAMRAFRVMGEALRTIRDSGRPSRRIYRETHATFEDYCRDRWGIRRDYADKLIAATTAVERIETHTNCMRLPSVESHARELARVSDPDQQIEVWQAVVEDAQEDGKKITAAFIRPYVDAALGIERDEPDPVETLLKRIEKLSEDDRERLFASLSI